MQAWKGKKMAATPKKGPMFSLVNIPMLFYLFVLYNVLSFTLNPTMTDPLFQVGVNSGGVVAFTWGDLWVVLGIVGLFVELVKSTRSTNPSIFEHGLSMGLFVLFLLEFLLIKQAGTSTFLILTLMQLLDVVAGFTISISTARRDWGN